MRHYTFCCLPREILDPLPSIGRLAAILIILICGLKTSSFFQVAANAIIAHVAYAIFNVKKKKKKPLWYHVPVLHYTLLPKRHSETNKYVRTLRKHAYSNILKMLPRRNENFQIKNSDIFHMSAQNIDCGYSLEPPR